jgi:hypothetical protein
MRISSSGTEQISEGEKSAAAEGLPKTILGPVTEGPLSKRSIALRMAGGRSGGDAALWAKTGLRMVAAKKTILGTQRIRQF